MSYSRKVFWGTFYQAISQLISVLVGVVSTVLLTRYLGPRGYGQFNTAIAFVGFFSVLGDLGVQAILAKDLSQNFKQKEKILGNVFVWRLISAVLMFMLIVGISRFMPYDEVVKFVIIIEGLRVTLYLFRSYFVVIPQVKMRMDLSALGFLISRLLYLGGVVLVVSLNLTLVYLFYLMFLAYMFDLIFMYFSFKKLGGVIILQFDKVFLKKFLSASVVLGVASVLGTVHHRIDTLILSVLKPSYDVGIYNVAYSVFFNFVVLPSLFLAVIFPRYSELAKKDKEWFGFFNFSLSLLWMVALPIAIFGFLFAPHLVMVIGGAEFGKSVLPLQILAFAIISTYVSAPFIQMAIALGKQNLLVLVTAFAVFVNVGLNAVLIPHYTYIGAAAATLISETSAFLLILWCFKKQFGINFDISIWFKSLIPLAIVSLFWYGLRMLLPLNILTHQSLIIEFLEIAAIFGVVFALYIILLGVFNLVPREMFREIIKTNEKPGSFNNSSSL